MKNLKIYKILCIAGVSIILVGCKNNTINVYENKEITIIEEKKATPEPTQESIKEQISTIVPTTTPESTKEPFPTPKPTPVPTPTSTPTQNIEENNVMTDEEVIEYIQKIGKDMNECADGIFDSVKSKFIIVVDFLFYDGTIGGRTFESLSDEAKGKVLALYDQISTYVEANWPTWKENLSEKYDNVKVLWNDKKDDLSSLWQDGKQKVKNWYENFREENK